MVIFCDFLWLGEFLGWVFVMCFVCGNGRGVLWLVLCLQCALVFLVCIVCESVCIWCGGISGVNVFLFCASHVWVRWGVWW